MVSTEMTLDIEELNKMVVDLLWSRGFSPMGEDSIRWKHRPHLAVVVKAEPNPKALEELRLREAEQIELQQLRKWRGEMEANARTQQQAPLNTVGKAGELDPSMFPHGAALQQLEQESLNEAQPERLPGESFNRQQTMGEVMSGGEDEDEI